MRNAMILVLCIFVLGSCCNSNSNCDKKNIEHSDSTATACCEHPENMVMVNEILSDPDNYVDKEISVCGIAIHVCEHSGKNLFVAENADDEDYMVARADDDLVKFNKVLNNKHVIVSGVFVKSEVESIETHHDKEVVYYLLANKVEECKCDGKNAKKCKGHEGKSGCCKTTEKEDK